MSAPLGDEPLGENSESCVNHERYRRCKRGEAFRTKVSHWGNPGRQNVFCEAQVRRPAHAVIPSLRVTRPGVFLYRENGRSIIVCCGLFCFSIPQLRHLLKCVPSSSCPPHQAPHLGRKSTAGIYLQSGRFGPVCSVTRTIMSFIDFCIIVSDCRSFSAAAMQKKNM